MPHRNNITSTQRVEQLGPAVADAAAGIWWRLPDAEVPHIVLYRARLLLQPDAVALGQVAPEYHPGMARQTVRIARTQIDAGADRKPDETTGCDRPGRHGDISSARSIAHHHRPLAARLVGIPEISRVQNLPAEAIHTGDIRQLRIVEYACRGNDGAIGLDALARLGLPQAVSARRDPIDFNAVLDWQLLLPHPINEVAVVLLCRGMKAPMQRKLAPGQCAEEARCIQPQGGIEAVPGGCYRLRTVDDAILKPRLAQGVGGIDSGGSGADDQHICGRHQSSRSFGRAVAVPRM